MVGGVDAFAATGTYGLVVQSISNFRISGTGLAPSQTPTLANHSSFTSVIWGGVSNPTNFGEDPLQSTAGDGPFPDENMFSPTGPGSSYARSDVLLDSNDALTGASFISIAELSTPPTGFAQAWANAAYTLTFDTVADGAITLSFSNSVSVVSTDALVRLQTEIVIRDLVNGDQVNWQPDGEPGNFSFSNPSGKGIQNSGLVVSHKR